MALNMTAIARCTRAVLFGCAALALLSGCAGQAESPQVAAARAEANDPIEPFNRWAFNINEGFDILLLRPTAVVYRDLVPPPLQDNTRNFLRNLRSPLIFANQLLQGDLEGAQNAAARFLVNSTIGFGGLADVAAAAGVPYEEEDFGQTLAVLGVPEGAYLVLPLYGPSTLRDTTGAGVESIVDPLNWWLRNNDLNWVIYTRIGVSAVDARFRLIEAVDDLRANSMDYYATVRSLYRQNRDNLIRDGQGTGDEFPEFNDPAANTPPAPDNRPQRPATR